jgi:hypothetical protein
MEHVNTLQFVAKGLGISKFMGLQFAVALLYTECPSNARRKLEDEYNGTKNL